MCYDEDTRIVREVFSLRMVLEELADAFPFSFCFAIVCWTAVMLLFQRKKDKKRPVLAFAACLYIGFLLYEGCMSRVDSFAAFMAWRIEPFSEISFSANLDWASSLSRILLNILFFLPLGFGGAWLACNNWRKIAIGALFGFGLSGVMKAFQFFHGMDFNLCYLLSNVLGILGGIAIALGLRTLISRIRQS